jgi:RNA polymerase sigma-70 factor, ECF subfamily
MIAATCTSNEQELLQQLLKGDFKAYEQLFKNYYSALCHHAFSYSGDAASAEDAVSDVFARIWERRSRLSIDTSVKSYLYRAVSNQCIDILRASYRKRVVLANDIPVFTTTLDDTDISSIPETRELAVKIELAIRNLPKQCGIIFRMSREAGMKYHEIAANLDISVKTVETQMGRAFKFLRSRLMEQELNVKAA